MANAQCGHLGRAEALQVACFDGANLLAGQAFELVCAQGGDLSAGHGLNLGSPQRADLLARHRLKLCAGERCHGVCGESGNLIGAQIGDLFSTQACYLRRAQGRDLFG